MRGLPELAEGFERSRARLGAVFFSPAFGGAYRVEEPGAAASAAVTTLLVGEAPASPGRELRSQRERRVELRRLDAENALAILERHRIARVDLDAWAARPKALAGLRPRGSASRCAELAAGRTGPDPAALAPASRLQLAVPTSTRPEVQRFVHHLQAFLAPADLGLAFAHAPDLLFARIAGVPTPLRERLAGWLQREGCMAGVGPRA